MNTPRSGLVTGLIVWEEMKINTGKNLTLPALLWCYYIGTLADNTATLNFVNDSQI